MFHSIYSFPAEIQRAIYEELLHTSLGTYSMGIYPTLRRFMTDLADILVTHSGINVITLSTAARRASSLHTNESITAMLTTVQALHCLLAEHNKARQR
jgi:hypothetical protein